MGSGRNLRADRWVNIASPIGIDSREWSMGDSFQLAPRVGRRRSRMRALHAAVNRNRIRTRGRSARLQVDPAPVAAESLVLQPAILHVSRDSVQLIDVDAVAFGVEAEEPLVVRIRVEVL